jgi:EAL and modified HD-GYP domain-containing signal transduction protein
VADVFVARQPIFDRDQRVAGYELLFRHARDNHAVIADNDDATSAVVVNTFTDFGLERVVGDADAWLNVSRSFVLDRLAFALPPDRVVLELLERQKLDTALVDTLRELRSQGFRIVLDDFVYDPSLAPLVEVADVVKIDIRAVGTVGAAEQLQPLRRFDVELLAEKVETKAEFRVCREMGFDLFQGYFFCRPEVLQTRSLGANRLAMLQLVAALQDERTELSRLETLILRDVALSYRLLRYMNSAFFGLRQRVDSVGRALALLGINNVRRWATMTILAGIEDKPQELIVTALVRARLCELLGPAMGERNGDQLFTLGLFSVIDAMVDAPMAEVLSSIPFEDDMLAALTDHEGPKGELLECVLRWERGDFDAASDLVPADLVAAKHLEALDWAKHAVEELLGPDDDAARAGRAQAA